MSDTGPQFSATAHVEADDSFDQLGDRIGKEIAEGLKSGFKPVQDEFRKVAAQMAKLIGKSKIDEQMRNAARATQGVTRGLRDADKEAADLKADLAAIAGIVEAQQNRKLKFVDPGQFALLNRVQEQLLAFQRQVAKTDFSNPRAVQGLRSQFEALRRLSTSAVATFQSDVKQTTDLAVAEGKRRTAAETAASRSRLEAQRAASQATVAITRREQDQILVASQRAARQRVQITRFALESLGRLERGFGAVVAGAARTATSGVARIYQDTLGRVSQAFQRSGRDITRIESNTFRERNSIFRSSLRSQERLLSQSATRQTEIIRTAQAKAQTGLIGASRRSSLLGLGGGLAGVGVLSLGLERFSNIERLTKQFTALTGSAETANTVLEQVKEFARLTPFDLVGVADLAKGFLAIKTPIDQVLPRVRAIADAVALTGGGVDELNRIQRAIGQVVSAGRLQGDELNQLAENLPGLNIRQILADQLTGGSTADLIKMQEAGEITGDLFVDGLITGLANDPRLKGASEDLAKTLSGRIANLKEVVADVGAAFIGLIADPMKEATKQATAALDALSSFIKGEVSPAFLVLRTAVGGAVLAIGGLLVAKLAAEALKVLATSARLLLTPFGAIVVVVGAIGAAFAVMRDRSEEFRDVTDRLGRLLGTQFGRVLESIGDAISKVRDAFAAAPARIDQTAAAFERGLGPARSWISEIGTKLASAIATAGTFLADTLVPALADVAIFIGRNAGPALSFVRDVLVDLGTRAADLGRAGFERLLPVLRQLRGFADEVGASLRGIVSGAAGLTNLIPVGAAALGGGLVAGPIGAIVAAVVAGFATLSPTIRESIVDGVRSARDRAVEIFRNIDWGDLAGGVLKFTERAGRLLGSIVSDRRFVAALAGIAAAAVAVAFNFVSGFVQGVISNAGELIDLGTDIGRLLLDGIVDFVTSNPIDSLLIVGGALLAANMVKIGRAAGQGLQTGLVGGLRQNASAGSDFLSSAFFGNGGPNRFIFETVRTAQKTADEVRRQLSVVSRSSGRGGVLGVGGLGAADVAAARTQFDQLTSTIGASATAGLRLRTAFQDTFSSIRTNSEGLRGVFSSIGRGLGDAAAAVKGQGAAIGSALGVGISGAFASALGGQQLGRGNTAIGLGGILSSALFSGLAVGGGPQGIAIGGAVAGIGLLTAAFTASKRKADEFRAAVDASSDSLTRLGKISGEEAVRSLSSTIGESLADEAAKTKDALADAGLSVEALADELIRLGADGGAGFKTVGETAGAFAFQVANDLRDTDGLLSDFAGVLETVRSSSPLAADALEGLIRQVESGAISGGTFEDAVKALFRTIDQQDSAIADAAANIRLYSGAQKEAASSASNLFESRLAGTALNTAFQGATTDANDLETAISDATTAADKLFNPTAGTLQQVIDDAILSLGGLADQVATGQATTAAGNTGLGAAQTRDAFRGVDRTIADIVKAGIETGASEADVDRGLRDLQATISTFDVPQETKDALFLLVEQAVQKDSIPLSVKASTESATKAGDDLRHAAEGALRAGNSAESLGQNITGAFARGISSKVQIAKVTRAARAAALAAKSAIEDTLDIRSPSRVFMGLGADTATGFALGLESQSDAVKEAARKLADDAAEATRQASEKVSLTSDLFSKTFAGDASLDAGKRSINANLGSILSAAQAEDREAWDRVVNGLAAGTTRSLELNLDGIGNRGLIAGAVEDIKNFGAAMLDAGKPISEITGALESTRADLINFASSIGFNRDQLIALIDQLGLSTEAIKKFGLEAPEVKATPREDDENGTGGGNTTIIQQENHLVIPFGDPEAIALSVANRTAVALRTRR